MFLRGAEPLKTPFPSVRQKGCVSVGVTGGKVLILNTGSSSVKFGLYSPEADSLLFRGRIERLGTERATLITERFYGSSTGDGEVMEEEPTDVKDAKRAIPFILDLLLRQHALGSLKEIVAVGHRVVHGGERYDRAALVTEEVKADIRAFAKFAPLHNPHNLVGIERCERLLKGTVNVAVFDTAFHQTMPEKAYRYGLGAELHEKYGIRKYGFHGTNHKYCSIAAGELLGTRPRRIITCHLGNGSSITAIQDGMSIDTSMGFTPTDGLIMGTRSGAIDPEAVLYLLRELHQTPERIDEFLNRKSGLKSIAGSADVRDIWRKARRGEQEAILALDMLVYQVVKYIGSYAAVMGGLDCLVFSGGIGENAWYVRSAICNLLGHLGIRIDTEQNQRSHWLITAPQSRVPVLVIRANEELQIGRDVSAGIASIGQKE